MAAVLKGKVDMAQLLILLGANVNAIDKKSGSVLMIALESIGNDLPHPVREKMVQILLERGADVNLKRADGATPLMAAAAFGYVGIAKMLLGKKSDVNAKMQGGWTPLLLAVDHGQKDMVALLLGAQADLTLARDDGVTALAISIKNNLTDITALLQGAKGRR